MTDVYSSSQFHVTQGREDEFIGTWHAALSWTKENYGDGFERARLLRDDRDPSHFVSFLEWDDAAIRDRWRGSDEYDRRMTQLMALCREVEPSSYSEAARVG